MDKQPNFCQDQVDMIDTHRIKCSVCTASYNSYMKNMKIPTTPMCSDMTSQLKKHIGSCSICNHANKIWNKNSVDIIPEMRRVAADIGSNKMPNKTDLGKTIKHLTQKLGIDIS